jgi:hypothetical protein
MLISKIGSEEIESRISLEVPSPPKEEPVSIAKAVVPIRCKVRKNGIKMNGIHSYTAIDHIRIPEIQTSAGETSEKKPELKPSTGFFCKNRRRS